jgi:hypothetical protein
MTEWSAFCEHDKIKQQCRICGGSSICEHVTVKQNCRHCGGSAFCDDDPSFIVLTETKFSMASGDDPKKLSCHCCGSAFCKHGKEKHQCRDCCSSAFCIHNKRKAYCRHCRGSAFCEHNKRKADCRHCGGSAFCEHGKRKNRCRHCGGSSICPHCKFYLGNSQYDGHCAGCFKHLYPDDDRSKLYYKHEKELAVRAFLHTHFNVQPLHTAHCDCSHRLRVDHLRVIGNTLLCVETDEHPHIGYLSTLLRKTNMFPCLRRRSPAESRLWT